LKRGVTHIFLLPFSFEMEQNAEFSMQNSAAALKQGNGRLALLFVTVRLNIMSSEHINVGVAEYILAAADIS